MLRKLCVITIAVFAMMGATAHGDTFFTQQGEINSAGGGTVSGIRSWTATGGSSFVNTNGALANGTGFTAIGQTLMATANLANGGNGFPDATAGSRYVAVFALQGTQLSGDPSTAFGVATSGVVAIYEVSNAVIGSAGFQTNPTQWTNGTLVSAAVITLPADVTQGNPLAEGTPFSALQINSFSVNLVALQQVQGRLLLDETTFGTSGGDLINVTTFDPFGPGAALSPEQFLVTFSENIVTAGSLVTDLNTAGADSFVQTLFGAVGVGVGANEFTDGGYTPGTPTSGDFASNLTNVLVAPGVQFANQEVPEPASLAIWGLGIAAAGIYGRRRMRRS